jgi:hypothetical protein
VLGVLLRWLYAFAPLQDAERPAQHHERARRRLGVAVGDLYAGLAGLGRWLARRVLDGGDRERRRLEDQVAEDGVRLLVAAAAGAALTATTAPPEPPPEPLAAAVVND